MTYTSTQTAGSTVTPTVAVATKSTVTNIKKLKIYLSDESKDRRNTKKIRK